MGLKEALRKAALDELSKIDLMFETNFARKHHEELNFLYENKIIDDESIEQALEKYVLRQARRDYQLTTAKRAYPIYPDHVGMPEMLAYGINKGIFTKKELKKISFDHGEDPEKFVKIYGQNNLLSKLREELLNPKPFLEFKGDYDPHPVCSCGH